MPLDVGAVSILFANPFRIEALKWQRFEKRVIKSTENSEEP
jgi:hypothetical protein